MRLLMSRMRQNASWCLVPLCNPIVTLHRRFTVPPLTTTEEVVASPPPSTASPNAKSPQQAAGVAVSPITITSNTPAVTRIESHPPSLTRAAGSRAPPERLLPCPKRPNQRPLDTVADCKGWSRPLSRKCPQVRKKSSGVPLSALRRW